MSTRQLTNAVFLVAALLLWFSIAFSQAPTGQSLQVGKVTENLVVQSHPDQSYAVFLPGNYTPDKAWPTVFCLDPRARGKSAIERFVQGAEKYGYVVLCSNNSRNGLNWPTIAEIFTNFWDDAHTRFNIDEKRTFAAGFSGGFASQPLTPVGVEGVLLELSDVVLVFQETSRRIQRQRLLTLGL